MLDYLPPTNGTDTSAVARHVVAGKAASDRSIIYQKIQANGLMGATCSEVMRWTGIDHASASARVWELAGGNNPDKYPILIAYLGEKRPVLDEHGEPKRTKARAYVALSCLPNDQAAAIRREVANRIRSKMKVPSVPA